MAAIALASLVACERLPAPQIVVSRRPELPDSARLRIEPDGPTSEAAIAATRKALRAAGFRVAPDRGTGRVYVVSLSADCRRSMFRGRRCRQFSARIVDPHTSLIVAAAAVNPLTTKPMRLSAIADTLATRLRGHAGYRSR